MRSGIVLHLVSILVGGLLGWVMQAELVGAQEASKRQRVVVAEEFRLVDKDNQLRAVLSADGDGAALYFRTKDGLSAAIGVSPDGRPHIVLSDKKGQARASLSLSDEGSPHLNLKDAEGKNRLSVLLSLDGRAMIFVLSNDTKQLITVGEANVGVPVIALDNVVSSYAGIIMFEKAGKPIWRAPIALP